MNNIDTIIELLQDIKPNNVIGREILNKLKDCADRNRNLVYGYNETNFINRLDRLIDVGAISDEDYSNLLCMAKSFKDKKDESNNIIVLRKMIKNNENIGTELIKLFDNDEVIKDIHNKAESQIMHSLRSFSGYEINDPEILFMSLVLIALQYYDGSYYDKVEDTYQKAYEYSYKQKVDGLIRTFLSNINKNKTGSKARLINIVLNNAIVPCTFLPAFFEFIFDIYKKNFECELPDDLYESFEFVYDGLRNSVSTDNDEFNISLTQKTYKLIKSTKELIIDKNKTKSLINLSIIVVKLIDKCYWNQEIKIFNSYLKYGFDTWFKETEYKKEIQEEKKHQEFRSKLKPIFIINNNRIYLQPSVQRVRINSDYENISVRILNNGDLIPSSVNFTKREIIGGYEINVWNILLENPFRKLSYQILNNDEIIYDSKDLLYRDFIVFNQENGKEIFNNTNFSGTAIICYQKNMNELVPYYKTDTYKLASKFVDEGDVIYIDDTVFSFSSTIKPGIFGEEKINYSICAKGTSEEIPVFTKITKLVFESENIDDKFVIVINGNRHKLNEFESTVNTIKNRNRYNIALDIKINGIYNIEIRNITEGIDKLIYKFNAVVDNKIQFTSLPIDNNNYLIEVTSGLVDKVIYYDFNVVDFDINAIIFRYKDIDYYYHIPFDIDIFKLDDKSWQPYSNDLWVDDIKFDSKLGIYNSKVEDIQIWTSDGTCIDEEVKIDKKGIYKTFNLGFLLSYKNYDYVWLGLLENGKVINRIDCYNKCILDDKQTYIGYDKTKKHLLINTKYHGKGKVFFKIFDAQNNELYKSDYVMSDTVTKLQGLKSFEKYNICFYEKGKGLISKDRLLGQLEKTIYDVDDFIGRVFKITNVTYTKYIKDKGKEVDFELRQNYIYFNNKISSSEFIGQVFSDNKNGIYWLKGINPVKIDICSDVIDNTMDLYITKDGDGLLLDQQYNCIMNTLEDKKATDIYLYTIDVNGEEYSEKIKSYSKGKIY